MRAESFEFLRTLVETASPSGFEQAVQKVFREYVGPYADDVRTDVHGNVIAVKNPGADLRVMIAGHCDEIGLMVTNISKAGYIYVDMIGGVDPSMVDGQRVIIHGAGGDVPGVIGKKPIHLMERSERGKPAKLHEMWIDIGARNKKDAEKVVRVGDPATIDVGLIKLRNGLVAARGFDDRVGAFVAAEAMRLLARRRLDVAFYCVSTVQEEVGCRGAITSSFSIDPHVGVAVDVGFASDFPTVNKNRVGDVSLGKGPILHRGPNINPVVEKLLLETCEKNKIPWQMQGEPRATGTDARSIQITRGGSAAGLVSIPNRYMHTPVEVVSLKDLESCSKLLARFVQALKPGMSFIP
jgi:putative aminopeptidase FrvX